MKIKYVRARTKHFNRKLNACTCSHDVNRLLVAQHPMCAKFMNSETAAVSYCPAIGDCLCQDEDRTTYRTPEEAIKAAREMYNTLLDELKDPETNIIYDKKHE